MAQISFHGAARTVTGSKHLVETEDGQRILLDCGLFQGLGAETEDLNRHFGFDPDSIDAVILSHAHIDHSGALPSLVKQGYRKKIYCTEATMDLCRIMLADTAHILASDISYINQRRRERGASMLKPLYTIDDVEDTIQLMESVPLNTKQSISKSVSFSFTGSGHILGSAAVSLKIEESKNSIRLFFSGDIGRYNDPLLINPESFPQADFLILESTYGDRLHPSLKDVEDMLQSIVHKTCVENRGKLIIPAFSLGRTQEVIYTLNNLKNAGRLPEIKVFVDSPLSVNATDIMRRHLHCLNEEIQQSLVNDPDPFGFGGLFYIQQVEDSKKLNDLKEPCIIISASGMADAGRIKHHLKNAIEDPRNTILIVGYCVPETLGGKLAVGQKEVKIFGHPYAVKATVQVMNSYSAHADYAEMIRYISCQNPQLTRGLFLVHGQYEAQTAWKEKLDGLGFTNVVIPELHETISLSS